MEFVKKAPVYGDHIRVNRGLYTHHAIYIDDENVVQFTSETGELDPKTAVVMVTPISAFLKGGELEVCVYNEEESKTLFSPQEIVNRALSRQGERGYDVVTNNCEHFANECAIDKHISLQEEMAEQFAPLLNLFFGR